MDNDKQILIESADQAKDLIEETYFEFVRSVRVKKDNIIRESQRLAEEEEAGEEEIPWDKTVRGFDFTLRDFVDKYTNARSNNHAAVELGLVKNGATENEMEAARKRVERLVERLNRVYGLGLPVASAKEKESRKSAKGINPGSGKNNRKLKPFQDNAATLFDGEVYADYTRIPPSRWRIFGKKTPVKQNLALPFFKKYDKIFLLGYQLENTPEVLYELWFDTLTSMFEIHDRSGSLVLEPKSRMNDAVNMFTDLVGDFAGGNIGKRAAMSRDMEEELEDATEDAVKDNLKQSARQAQRESVEPDQRTMTELLSEETVDVEAILERSINTRGMLANIINDELFEEYDDSRMTRRLAKNKFWEVFGKKPEFPSKFLNRGSRNSTLKIRGRQNEATFIRGFEFAGGRVELEIWLVKTRVGGRSGEATFWVFNITSGEVVASDLRRIRDAYAKVGAVLAAATD